LTESQTMGNDDRQSPHGRAEEVLQLFRKGADFTRELLQENERLRYRVLQLEQEASHSAASEGLAAALKPLQVRIAELEDEKATILQRIRMVEEENINFANRFIEVENENNRLANLYIASYQMHSTLDLDEVLRTITEIIINLIGAEVFAILLREGKSDRLMPMVAEGVKPDAIPVVRVGEGELGNALQQSAPVVQESVPSLDLARPQVIIPLRINDEPVGAIVLYALLQQKTGFDPVDHELFALLADHAAAALSAASLYARAVGQRSHGQEFIELFTP